MILYAYFCWCEWMLVINKNKRFSATSNSIAQCVKPESIHKRKRLFFKMTSGPIITIQKYANNKWLRDTFETIS
jgi:hypothetical protein